MRLPSVAQRSERSRKSDPRVACDARKDSTCAMGDNRTNMDRTAVTTPHKTKLPDAGTFTLKDDTIVDGADLDRFVTTGGVIVMEGYKLFVNSRLGQKTLEKTPHGQTTTIN